MVLMVGSRLCIAPVGSSLKGYKYIRVAWQRPTVCVRSCALQTPYPIEEPALREGPSCVFVGPVETAQKDRLEALYRQARDSYYNGQPLIVDDMFDKVEVRLRWYGSKLVMKYPRCSLKRLSVYSDAEADNSQILALASIWMLFLVIGLISALGVPVCTLSRTCKETAHYYLFNHVHNHMLSSDLGISMNVAVIAAMGVLIGVPVSTAALGALKGLWKGDLIALKGSCPSCGEEVYAFIRTDKPSDSRQKTECHMCEHPLVFHAKLERSADPFFPMPWAYGRVYLARRTRDLSPP